MNISSHIHPLYDPAVNSTDFERVDCYPMNNLFPLTFVIIGAATAAFALLEHYKVTNCCCRLRDRTSYLNDDHYNRDYANDYREKQACIRRLFEYSAINILFGGSILALKYILNGVTHLAGIKC